MSDYNVGDRIVVTVQHVRTVTDVKSHGGGTDYTFDRGLPGGGRIVGYRKQADPKRFEAINTLMGFADGVAGEIATSSAEQDRIVMQGLNALKALGIAGDEIQQAKRYEKAKIRASIKRKK